MPQPALSCTRTFSIRIPTGVAVPDDRAIHCSDAVTVAGNISRRTSVITPKDIHINGPLRYVDDEGGTMWELVDKETGEPATFDEEQNSWSMMGNWSGGDHEYRVAPDWHDRSANAQRGKPPALGLMSGSTIYLDGNDWPNREIHAALFCSGDVVRPGVASKKNNLYIHGAIITAGTNPVSSFFSYRTYAYDPNLRKYPPPEFEQTNSPAFCNWHVIKE